MSTQTLTIASLSFPLYFHLRTLAVNPQFTILLIVIVFHQAFEGLGLGSRLAYLPLPKSKSWVPYAAGTLYAFVTPFGMAVGLGVRNTYQSNSVASLVASGVLDSISAGAYLCKFKDIVAGGAGKTSKDREQE